MTQYADDQVLIDRAKDGDRAAFDSLVDRYQERAYKYAYRLTRNQDLAGDVVADAFVRVYAALKNFRGNSAFGTWLYRIITNCYFDRKKRNREAQNSSLSDTVSVKSGEVQVQYESDDPGPDFLAERSARERILTEALEQMHESQKAILVMYHVEDLSYEEIAESLDMPIGTVKSRLNRARVALRDLLAGHTELFQMG